MSELSMSTISIAITAMAAERDRLLQRISKVRRINEENERLSERVMDIDRALDEIGTFYESQRAGRKGWASFNSLMDQ